MRAGEVLLETIDVEKRLLYRYKELIHYGVAMK